jgi:predicted enzyme related to lactoylglutathione lyase
MNTQSGVYENLRKRAKHCLRDARSGDEPTLWRFKRLHPKFAAADLAAIRDSIKLADAQLVIAREWGYSTWAALKEGAHRELGSATVSAKLDVNEMVPFIPAKDFAASVRFYEELFVVNWRTDTLCQIQAGRSKFLIQNYYQADWVNNSMYQLTVDDADATWQTLKSSGVLTRHGDVRAQAPKQEPWGRVVYLWGPAGELWHLTQRP